MTIKECAEFIRGLDNIHIYTHIHPDGDALGSSFALVAALKKMGKRAKVICLDALPEYLSYIWKIESDDFEAESIITSDVADTTLLGDFGERKIDLVIDHHIGNRLVADKKLVIPEAAATGEITFELIKELGVTPDKYIAECLYTAISTDTGCFKFSNTTEKTFSVVSELCRYSDVGNFAYLNAPLFITKSKDKMKFESEIIQNLSFYLDGKVSFAVVTDALIKKHNLTDGDTGGVEQLGKTPEGVVLAITLKERPNGFKVSLRSDEEIDSSQICAAFGGGGHKCAAGCFFEDTPENITKILLSYVKEAGIL